MATALDLPIALGVLVASGQVPGDRRERQLVVGEVGLEGDVPPADLDGAGELAAGHVAEAIQYRSLDRRKVAA